MFKSSSTQLIVLGVLSVLVGIIAIAWPGVTILALVILFAIYAFIDAGLEAMTRFASGTAGPVFGHLLLDLMTSRRNHRPGLAGPTALMLVLIVGFWAFIGGFAEIFAGFGDDETAGTRAMFIITGLLSIAFGVVLLVRPNIGAVTLALLYGLFSLIYGVAQITMGTELRRTGKTLGSILGNAACDALTAKVIELAGYPAYQIGGFALVGSRFGYPDIDLAQFGENSAVMRDTIAASSLPVLVDADNAYGDAKNVTRVVQGYEAMGASAIFLEDQQAPKRCGHMLGKKVIPAEEHVGKLRAAAAARHNPETFIIARTDALAPLGLDEALRRAELYLKAGADGVYIEAVETVEQLEKVGKSARGAPLATSILEGGGRTPWMDPKDLHALGYTMLLYPTTVIFRVTRAIQKAVDGMGTGSYGAARPGSGDWREVYVLDRGPAFCQRSNAVRDGLFHRGYVQVVGKGDIAVDDQARWPDHDGEQVRDIDHPRLCGDDLGHLAHPGSRDAASGEKVPVRSQQQR